MAERPVFFIRSGKVASRLFTFEWFPGFAVSQKQKSIESLHKAVLETDPGAKPLEISTKGKAPLGVKLSAFNLRLNGSTLENVFQSAKVFENGGPYLDLLALPPKEAKRDPRLRESGALTGFLYQSERFPLTPKTAFYDYIYLAAAKESLTRTELCALSEYNYFTDIEFNPAKSINTQARTVPLIKLLLEEHGCIPDFTKDSFIRYHRNHAAC